jgi:hypothetical protein
VLQTGEAYKLADLPALTRATTKMLTSDPVVSELHIYVCLYVCVCVCVCVCVFVCVCA